MYEKQIAKGIAFLAEHNIDVLDPKVVNVYGIRMEDGEPSKDAIYGKCGCIIAQTLGSYHRLRDLGVDCWGKEATSLGFLGDDNDSSYDTLTEEWKATIRAERAARGIVEA